MIKLWQSSKKENPDAQKALIKVNQQRAANQEKSLKSAVKEGKDFGVFIAQQQERRTSMPKRIEHKAAGGHLLLQNSGERVFTVFD